MACFFLAGSVLLPLGDFSLMRDIPGMYRNYTRITTTDEVGVLDFIGDYLLHGKEIFGHNEHDKSQSSTNNVQFQHQANPLIVILLLYRWCAAAVPENSKKQLFFYKQVATSVYNNKLFRPPLAQALPTLI